MKEDHLNMLYFDKYLPSEGGGTDLREPSGAFVQNNVTNLFLCAIFSFTESPGIPVNDSKEKMRQGKAIQGRSPLTCQHSGPTLSASNHWLLTAK